MRTILTRLILRNARALEWTSKNPVLLEGEPGYETDTGLLKIGDGETAWNELDYLEDEPGPEGPAGPPGETGPRGEPGTAGGVQALEFSFASPSTTWTINHNLETKAIEVNAFDFDGIEEKEGSVSYPDVNTVVVEWYFPESGIARILY